MFRGFRLRPRTSPRCDGTTARRAGVLCLAACLLLSPLAEGATLLDPRLKFRTLATPHFRIYFHRGEEQLAARLAGIAEEAWTQVGGALGVQAPRLTHVILADQSEIANGWATPIPYNTIFVTAAAPSGAAFIGNQADWLRLVFTHEFAHIVHLDRSQGWARIFRGILGRTPIAFPNLWLPAWQIEGLATWQESALSPDRQGRQYAGDFRAIERESARSGRLEPLDRVNGGLSDWPSGFAAYAYGLGFHEYLAEQYGPERLGQLASETARRLPFTGAFAFDNVFGRSLTDLWNDYSRSVLGRTPASQALTSAAPRQLTTLGYVVAGPRFAPPQCETCPAEIMFVRRGPDRLPELAALHADTGRVERLTTRYLGDATAVSRDWLIFDQQELRRNTAMVSDLYAFDRRTGATTALTRDERLQDPDLSPDGATIACVREHDGQRDLVLVRLVRDEANRTALPAVERIDVLIAEPGTQFNTPRWSPDGRTLAVARQRPEALTELVTVDVETKTATVIASDSGSRIITPSWSPTGDSIIAAADFDEGPFNLYEFRVRDGAVRRLTSTTGGALWPDVSNDRRTIVFAGYTTAGYDLFSIPFDDTSAFGDAVRRAPVSGVARQAPASTLDSSPYSPWRTLLPTTWEPVLINDGDQIRGGAAVSGYDVLARHAYYASATWLLDASTTNAVPDQAIPDWTAAYAYNRWRPVLFVSASSETLFRQGQPENGQATESTIRRREIETGIQVPMHHVRVSQTAVASVVSTTDDFLVPGERSSRRLSTRAGYLMNSSHEFDYSISRERGATFGATVETSRHSGGGSTGSTTFTADARGYVPGFGGHHVLALRAGGGHSSNPMSGRLFLLGGGGGNLSAIDFGSGAFSLLRGFPSDSFAGTSVAVVNADYRWPIARPQRGVNVWPFFLHSIHAAATADAANAWTGSGRLADAKTSAGGELSFDLVFGYSFPLTATFGGAWGRDGATGDRGATGYVRFGRAF